MKLTSTTVIMNKGDKYIVSLEHMIDSVQFLTRINYNLQGQDFLFVTKRLIDLLNGIIVPTLGPSKLIRSNTYH